jgi:C_GCAxxG_C_C family probable redox protein
MVLKKINGFIKKDSGEQMQGLPRVQGLLNGLKIGHCAPSVMRTLQQLQGDEDERVLKLTSGMPGGIGWLRAECGCVTSAVMMMGLMYGEDILSDGNEQHPGIISMGQNYLSRFSPAYGGLECSEISRVDYHEKRDVKKNALGSSLRCFKAICGSPVLLMGIMGEEPKDTPSSVDGERLKANEKLLELYRTQKFHCSQSVLHELDEFTGGDESILRASWGFLGGTLMQGMTCGALTAGVSALGLKFGEIEDSYLRVMRWTLQLLIDGDIKREDLNKFNRSINISWELAKWFEWEFGSTRCRDLTRTDFNTPEGVDTYISENKLEHCKTIAEKTANKVREIINTNQ